jgi:hypothetical protein
MRNPLATGAVTGSVVAVLWGVACMYIDLPGDAPLAIGLMLVMIAALLGTVAHVYSDVNKDEEQMRNKAFKENDEISIKAKQIHGMFLRGYITKHEECEMIKEVCKNHFKANA